MIERNAQLSRDLDFAEYLIFCYILWKELNPSDHTPGYRNVQINQLDPMVEEEMYAVNSGLEKITIFSDALGATRKAHFISIGFINVKTGKDSDTCKLYREG